MGFAKNISISIIFHLIFIAVAFTLGGNSNFKRNSAITVSIFEDNLISDDNRKPQNVITAKKSPSEKNKKQQKEDRNILSDTLKLNGDEKTYDNSGTYVKNNPPAFKSPHPPNNPPLPPGNPPTSPFTKGGQRGISKGGMGGLNRFSLNKQQNDIGYNSALQNIRTAIENNLIYPYIALKKKIEGTVITEFSINSKGLPENIRIIKSSGFNILDSTAKNTVVKASPFPVVKGYIEVPITFRLKKE